MSLADGPVEQLQRDDGDNLSLEFPIRSKTR